jgi:hypothetical protein
VASSLGERLVIAVWRRLMSSELHKFSFEIVPPIIFNDGADVAAYSSVEASLSGIEVVDVLNNLYEFHDSTGRVLEARVDKKKISLIPTSRVEADSPVLRGYMLQMLRLRGVEGESLASAPFGDLARLLLETVEKNKHR